MKPITRATAIRVGVVVMGTVVGLLIILRFLSTRETAADVLARPWETTPVLGLTLSAPGELRSVPVPVPDAMQGAVDRMESWGRNAGRTEMRVSRTDFRAGVPLNLEGSAQGAIDAMRASPAVTGMTHSHARTAVSGVPAVRTTSRFHVEGRPAHGEILSVLRGRTLWQVQVLGPEKDAPEIARRVMESVRLQP
jgi:hypothetical protein